MRKDDVNNFMRLNILCDKKFPKKNDEKKTFCIIQNNVLFQQRVFKHLARTYYRRANLSFRVIDMRIRKKSNRYSERFDGTRPLEVVYWLL